MGERPQASSLGEELQVISAFSETKIYSSPGMSPPGELYNPHDLTKAYIFRNKRKCIQQCILDIHMCIQQ